MLTRVEIVLDESSEEQREEGGVTEEEGKRGEDWEGRVKREKRARRK
jgi:hypothetical protein